MSLSRNFAAASLCVLFIASTAANARPLKWCGYFARFNLVSSDPGDRFNAACAWRDYGSPASGPAIGVIVVWCTRHHRHVGKIVGGSPGGWIVRSGNDSGRVRERVRDVSGATLRWPR